MSMIEVENLNVDEFYAFSAIYLVGKRGLGRRRLAEELGLTESKTRTMLDHLKDSGYIETGEKTILTDKGEEVFSQIDDVLIEVSEVDLEYLGVGEYAFAALVDIEKSFSVIELRDEAVRAGAKGLTVLEYDDGFTFPEDDDPTKESFENDIKHLENYFSAEKDFKLLISSGKEKEARKGLWRSIYHLIQN